MPRRKAKKSVKHTEEVKIDDTSNNGETQFVDEEVERQIAAIRAIRDVEVEQTRTALKLLCSYFTEEQLEMPVLEFFKENLPDLSLSQNEETGEIELKWKDENGETSKENGVEMTYSIIRSLYSRQSLGGYDLPDNVKASLLGTDNPDLENLVFQGTSENQMLASHSALRTPEVNGHRLSFGMTPKTRRQPKAGEMMLSVHGSPLGVFKEDHNMGAITEENS
ncbi:hypothetical protein AALP_AA7G274700 [Arabis alpina]|uniref:Uncharacterized protein n=1 Tax=Arabis alpina TaxID=50452 RepID=A0A087GKY1_ARAAL|nr:hypothetical protein AALP_AA7G274700 [Arabis alpina]